MDVIKAKIEIDPKLIKMIEEKHGLIVEAMNKAIMKRAAEIKAEMFLAQLGFVEPTIETVVWAAWIKQIEDANKKPPIE